MKKTLAALVAGIALGFTGACGPTSTDNHQVIDIVQNIATPGKTYDYQSSFASALSCDPATLVWSITETGDHTSATCLDGCVTPAGAFTAPHCSSAYIGTTIHVTAFCPSNSLTGSASIAISQELLNSLDVAAAVVFPGTAQACLAHTPASITVPIGSQITFYSRLTFTCETIWPVQPPTLGAFNPPLTLPQCAASVSP